MEMNYVQMTMNVMEMSEKIITSIGKPTVGHGKPHTDQKESVSKACPYQSDRSDYFNCVASSFFSAMLFRQRKDR